MARWNNSRDRHGRGIFPEFIIPLFLMSDSTPSSSSPAPASPPATRDAPAFDFYPERWSQGTRHMNKVERCDYLDLLNFQWTEQGVPGDEKIVAQILGYKKPSQIPPAVLAKFPLCADGKRRNARLEIVRHEQRERIAKSREKGRRMSEARWKHKHAPSNPANAPQAHAQGDPPACPSASPEGYLGDHAVECPPLTAHHSPPTTDSIMLACGVRPTLVQAKEAAGILGITEAEAEEWWHAREASDWVRGVSGGGITPVGVNWHSDARSFTTRARERKANEARKAASRGSSQSAAAGSGTHSLNGRRRYTDPLPEL